MFCGLNSRLKDTLKRKISDLTKSEIMFAANFWNEQKKHAGMKNLKLSLQVKKVISEWSKSRSKRFGSNLIAKKLSKSITATF